MDDGGEALIRYVLLRIYGPDLDPQEITAQVALEPFLAYRRGDPHAKTGRPRSIGMWQISSQRHIDSDELDAHIMFVLDQIEPVKETVQRFISREGIKADLYCYWEIEGNGGVVLRPAVLDRIASMNLELGIVISYR